VAASALMIDYGLTVTVSIAAGTAALTSAIPALTPWTTELCILFVGLLMLANLRGLRESGRLFLVPTYLFILSIFGLLLLGLGQQILGVPPPSPPSIPAQQSVSLFLILRAFSAGCTALTGIEAISNGVPVFRVPEWINARRTMLAMGVILGSMFLGITFLTHAYQIVPTEGETVLSLLGRQILGTGPLYYGLQAATLLILILAANTSYADFPRLASLLARDQFLPRQLMRLGDRLVYSNGILLLSGFATVLLFIFQGSVNRIIPLYAVGVFTSFTLSQFGMVRHWLSDRRSGWLGSALVNGLGGLATMGVLLVIISTKFRLGAWVVVLAIPMLVALFLAIRRHYRYVNARLSLQPPSPTQSVPPPVPPRHSAIVLVGQLNQGSIAALDYARTIAQEIVAVHVDMGIQEPDHIRQDWETLERDIPLVILDSPYRTVAEPLANFVANFEAQNQASFSTVIIPMLVTHHWWENLLHNQTGYFLKNALKTKKSRIISTYYHYL
ncbi:APC family permease, partial [Lyngbya confervoides]